MLNHWYRSSLSWVCVLLLPLSWLFRVVIWFRKKLYDLGIFQVKHFSVPVIVVGNLTVGGTGKTPTVIAIAKWLALQGYKPGIVSRGVGGSEQGLHWVESNSDVRIVGDEALLLKLNTECPVVVSRNRVLAVSELLKNTDCDIVLSDDGLQHYRLGRALEIMVVDGERMFGNKQLLPAGPLREPISRLNTVDFILVNGKQSLLPKEISRPVALMELSPTHCALLLDDKSSVPLVHFKNKTVHGVAAIGNPKRFFSMLREYQIDVKETYFPDHALFKESDFQWDDADPILMTEKDAVKCKSYAKASWWYVKVEPVMDGSFFEFLKNHL